jgi:hypothetical protein
VGHYLATSTQLTAIRAAVYASSSYTSANLILSDGTGTITADLWLLAARPLAQLAGHTQLYLLTLVDERYFWQRDRVTLSITEATTSWANVYTALAAAVGTIGVTLSAESVAAAYLKPSKELATVRESVPRLLDAVAYSVGQRVTRSLSGDLATVGPVSAATTVVDNLDDARTKTAGGMFAFDPTTTNDLPGVLPTSVAVVFRRTDSGSFAASSVYTSTVTLASLALSDFTGAITGPGTVWIHDSAVATYTGGASPTNQTELDALAQKIATDWYRWAVGDLDIRYPGLVNWTPDGLSDRVEWTYRAGDVSTRVIRGTWDWLVEDMFHAGSGTPYSIPASQPIPFTVEELDGAPSVTPCYRVQLDSADGFAVTNPSTGVARIDWTPPATVPTLAGDQTWTGDNTYGSGSDTLYVSGSSVTYNSGSTTTYKGTSTYTSTYAGTYQSGSSTTYSTGSTISLGGTTTYPSTYVGTMQSGSSLTLNSGSTTTRNGTDALGSTYAGTMASGAALTVQSGATTTWNSGSSLVMNGTLSGTIAGTPTFSGGVIFSTAPTFPSGTYGLTAGDVAATDSAGAAATVSRSDHTHAFASWSWTIAGSSGANIRFAAMANGLGVPANELIVPNYAGAAAPTFDAFAAGAVAANADGKLYVATAAGAANWVAAAIGGGTVTGTSSGTNTGDQFIFKTIAVSGQSDVVADTTADTLTLVAGTGITLTTNATTDTITIASSAAGTVTTVSVVTANGVSGSVATASTTPAITLTLAAITPTTVTASDALSVTVTDASTTTTPIVATFVHTSSAGPLAGFGSITKWRLKDSASVVDAANLTVTWVVSTDTSQTARAVLNVFDTSAREVLRGQASGSAPMIGFLGTAAAIQQTGDVGTAAVTFGLMSGTPTFAFANLTGTILGSSIPYACYENQQTSGTNGGTATSGAWRTCTLNTEVKDASGIGTIGSNQVTLAAGTYRCRAWQTGGFGHGFQIRIQNVTAGTTLVLGPNNYASNQETDWITSAATAAGEFTVAASQALELQYQIGVTKATNGLGVAASFGTEVYAQIEFWKVA